ncbi:uncharacterized protein GGS22DRAFT_48600 [Annulohypoxylon maeteangense]|uniref:uncharacterized protein n=1 Tax=Annulohypoxylon maeteangense TaxID=1927788 RepID=UPI00200727F2|nr:uncharacterized protein GGS22DRAFT_48600 [Annulohypoxylon maeteangense]KAI0882167.1 hypothetical protein GGS22DRAFT_48600 [Annulohypoxylon maeteangense]
MIRHPMKSAVGHARPDLSRVADGIAASLRQFSISARRCADQNNDNDNSDARRLSSRQRAAAAVSELIGTVENTIRETRDLTQKADADGAPNALRGGSKVVTTPPGFKGIRRTVWNEPNSPSPSQMLRGPNVIRGGFRAGFQGRGGRGAGMRGGGIGMRGGRGGMRGGRGDDRPRRGRGRGRRRAEGGGAGGEGRGRRPKRGGDREDDFPMIAQDPRVKDYLESRETGYTTPFNPSISLESLAGWGPGLATSATPFAQSEAVIRQARVLGGGNAFHPTQLVDRNVLRERFFKGGGIFIPPSEYARTWVKSILRDKEVVDGETVYKEKKFEAHDEVKTAVLEDVLLGKYDGPTYTEPSDVHGVLASYVKKDGTWNAAAGRGLDEKVRRVLNPPPRRGGDVKRVRA